MRVLQVTPYFAPAFCYGGPPRSILGLSRALIERHVEVEVFTTTANLPRELEPSSEAAVLVEGIPTRRFPLNFLRRFFGATGLSAALDQAIRKADLIHVHGLWNVPSYLACWHARLQRKPYLISPRGMLTGPAMRTGAARKRWAYRLLDHANLRHAAALHATSDQESEGLRSLLPGQKTFTIPNGIDPPDPSTLARGEWRSKLGIGNAPLVLYLGRMHSIKRLDLLAAAFDQVRARHPDAILILAGSVDLRYQSSLQQLIGSSPQVKYIGELEDDRAKWNLLTDANALVLCSDSENFGICVAEALAAGTPVVVTRTCPWKVLESSGSGLWVEQHSAAIATGILRIVENPDLASEMRVNGRTLVARMYGWASIGESMAAEYRSILWS
jgi:glycosyltransferase involved in cell wall biosynthesis